MFVVLFLYSLQELSWGRKGKKWGQLGETAFSNINSYHCHLGHLKAVHKDWNMEVLLFSNLKEEESLLFQGREKRAGHDNSGMLGILRGDAGKSLGVIL